MSSSKKNINLIAILKSNSTSMSDRLTRDYFRSQNALVIAEDLLGKVLVRNFENGELRVMSGE